MKGPLLKFFFFLLFLIHAHCGDESLGGTEAGNPPDTTRKIAGLLTNTSSASVGKNATPDACSADTVVATNSKAQTTSATADNDCSFTLNLEVNKSYTVGLVLNDTFVASMVFNHGESTLTSPVIIVSTGTSAIDLGLITISGKKAYPQNEPSTQNDQDGDGESDFEDDDDDNDGRPDDEEDDCDLDGHPDDHDEDDSECDTEEDEDEDDDEDEDTTTAMVLEARPPHDKDLTNEENFVDLDEDIEARTNCEIASASVNNATFVVSSQSGENITCSFSLYQSDKSMRCEHDEDFLTGTVYTVSLEGITCADGRSVEPKSWQWKTVTDD